MILVLMPEAAMPVQDHCGLRLRDLNYSSFTEVLSRRKVHLADGFIYLYEVSPPTRSG